MKIWAYLALAALLVGAAAGAYSKAFNAGRADAILEQENNLELARQEAVVAAKIKWDVAAGEAEAVVIIEEVIREKIIFIDREVPVAVETIKYECRDLGVDYLRVFNAAISATDSLQGSDAEIAAALDDSL